MFGSCFAADLANEIVLYRIFSEIVGLGDPGITDSGPSRLSRTASSGRWSWVLYVATPDAPAWESN